jgi:hypothetical protein
MGISKKYVTRIIKEELKLSSAFDEGGEPLAAAIRSALHEDSDAQDAAEELIYCLLYTDPRAFKQNIKSIKQRLLQAVYKQLEK